MTQQLREATPFEERPQFLIRDNDAKYGPRFDRLVAASGIRVLRTPIRAPRANATCERFLGSVRRECLDHILILTEAHLRHVLKEYVAYFNRARPHQGLGQRLPQPMLDRPSTILGAKITAIPVRGGLYYDYRRAA